MTRSRRKQYTAVAVLSLLVVASGFTSGGVALSTESTPPTPLVPTVCEGCTVPQAQTTDELQPRSFGIGPSAGIALSLRADALNDRVATLAYRDRLIRSRPEDRTAVIDTELRTIRTQADALTRQQAEVLERHAVNDVTTEHLLVELARIDASARRLELRRAEAASGLDDLSAASVDTRTLRADIMALQGPVRQQVALTATGAVGGGDVHVEASRQSVRLATQTDRETVVESYWSGYLGTTAETPVTIEGAAELIATAYPDQWTNRTGYTVRSIDTNLLYVEFEHTDGVIVVYVDRTSATMFKEFHYGPLDGALNQSSHIVGETTRTNETKRAESVGVPEPSR